MVAPLPKPPALPPLYPFMVGELRRAFNSLGTKTLAWGREDCARVSRVLCLAQAALEAQEGGYAPFRAPSLCDLEAAHECAVNIRQEWEARRAGKDAEEDGGEEEEEPEQAMEAEQAQEAVPEPVPPCSDPWQFAMNLLGD